jgi:Leu/Phe-tRNA-protein transferase
VKELEKLFIGFCLMILGLFFFGMLLNSQQADQERSEEWVEQEIAQIYQTEHDKGNIYIKGR